MLIDFKGFLDFPGRDGQDTGTKAGLTKHT